MRSGYVTGVLTADLYVDDTTKVNDMVKKLLKGFPTADITTDDNYIFVADEQSGNYTYASAVYYTSNGDGSPEEYEDDLPFFDEADVMDTVRDVLKGFDFEFDKVAYERKYADGYF